MTPAIRTRLLLAFTLATVSLVRPASAEEKPARVVTIGPAVALDAKQRADAAAKGVPAVQSPAKESLPNAKLAAPPEVSPRAEALAPAPDEPAAVKPRRLPGVSESLGPIPRAAWRQLAAGKPADVATIRPAAGREVKR